MNNRTQGQPSVLLRNIPTYRFPYTARVILILMAPQDLGSKDGGYKKIDLRGI